MAIAIVAGMAAAGIASASWTAAGDGNAKAQAGRLQAVTASPATPTDELLPGTSADAALTLTNPNRVAMTVSSITDAGEIKSSSAECDAAGHGVTFTDQTGAWEVAKNASLPLSLANAVRMSVDSADVCQGASFTIPVSVTASVSGQGGSGTATTTTTSTTTPASLVWEPSSYAYPAAEVGTPQTAAIGLRNTGGAPAQVEQGAMSSPDFAVLSTTCNGVTLNTGDACSFTIRFATMSPGQKNATYAVRVLGSSAWVTLTLSGTALTPASLVVEPPSWHFGSVAVGGSAPVKTFTVRNTGQAPTRSFSTQIVGPDAASFGFAGGTCSTTPVLNAGATCTVNIGFHASSPGSKSATFRADYNTTNFATAALSGQGT